MYFITICDNLKIKPKSIFEIFDKYPVSTKHMSSYFLYFNFFINEMCNFANISSPNELPHIYFEVTYLSKRVLHAHN